MAGIMCNDPDEGVYLVNFNDADGEKYKAEHRYRIHFDADNMPPVDSFWSLGMYGTDLNLVANRSTATRSVTDRGIEEGLRRGSHDPPPGRDPGG